MQLLDRTTHAIGTHQDLRKVFEVVLRSLEDALGVDFGCICVYQSEPEQLDRDLRRRRSATLGRQIGLVEQAQIEVDDKALAAACAASSCTNPDIESTQLAFPARLAQRRTARAGRRTAARSRDEVFGVLLVAKRRSESFSSDDCEFLRQLSSHVALAAHQARLYDALQSRLPGPAPDTADRDAAGAPARARADRQRHRA